MNQTLNEDGFLSGPSTSHQNGREPSEELLLASHGEYKSGQRSPLRKRRHTEGSKENIPQKRFRLNNRYSAPSLGRKVEKSKASIEKLEAHRTKKTCPKDLRYNVRVNIVPDDDFKSDIKLIRREAEKKLIGALTRYHYRIVETNKIKLSKVEHRPNTTREKKTNNPDVVKNRPRPERPTRTENVIALATELTDKIKKVEEMMKTLHNKKSESYPCVFSDCSGKGREKEKRKIVNNKHRERKSNKTLNIRRKNTELNQRYIKNLSNCKISTHETNLLSRGLMKFIQTPIPDKNRVRQQLLRDFKHFARRMRLRYIFNNKDGEKHPFHVKSNWEPPVQPSVALETYLEEIKVQLAEIEITKPRNNLPYQERIALKDLKSNTEIVIKKADKGSTTVIMNKQDKITEGQTQLDDRKNYMPLETPMVKETSQKVKDLINELHLGNHIDAKTKEWLSQTPNPPRIPVYYTLTKIHKPTLTGRPIISGCEGPTERISSFIDHILQPIAKAQKSYLKDTTDFINFIERTKSNKIPF